MRKDDAISGCLLFKPAISSKVILLLLIKRIVIIKKRPVLMIEWLNTCIRDAVTPSGVRSIIAITI